MLFPLLFCKQQCNFLEGECISLLTVSHLACYQISNPIQVWSWLEQAECIGEGLGETLLVDRFAGEGGSLGPSEFTAPAPCLASALVTLPLATGHP